MITMEDNKRKFKTGDTVELIKDKIEFKKGSLFVVISNITMRGRDAVTVKSKLDNQEYWIYNNELKLYESNDGKEIFKNFSNNHEVILPKSYFDREFNVGKVLKNRFKDIEESNKKDSNDTLTLSQVLKELADEWQEQDLKKLKKNNISKDKNTKSKFNIKPMNIIIHKGLFKDQRCKIISEQDNTYTIRLLGDENSNAIKINKSDLLAQNEHEYEEGEWLSSIYKYKINKDKTTLMNKNNKILASTVCNESDIFDKNKALEICRHKHLIKKYEKAVEKAQNHIQIHQKALDELINE